MSLMKYLKEELQSSRIMAGRTNCYFDEAKGSYQVFYKGKDGTTYQFTAISENETYDDTVWKLSLSRKIQGDTEMIPEEEVENFTEAITDWVNNSNPTSFYFIWSEKYPAYNKIAEKLSKKLKEYNFIDESKQTHEDQKYDVIEETPETQYKRFIFTRHEIKEELKPEDWFEKKMDEFSKTTGIYEPVEDIKTNKEHTTPFAKNGKLDKGVDYKNKKLS